MIEVELKYHLADPSSLIASLQDSGATIEGPSEFHEDTYYNHPCRDFAETKEAFRVRRIDGRAWMTYKGNKLPGDVKARREIELPIGLSDADGRQFEQALELLSFRRVATVSKRRRTYHWDVERPGEPLSVAVDSVDELGDFVEIECMAAGESGVTVARRRVSAAAESLGLGRPEPRSYLTLLLSKNAGKD